MSYIYNITVPDMIPLEELKKRREKDTIEPHTNLEQPAQKKDCSQLVCGDGFLKGEVIK